MIPSTGSWLGRCLALVLAVIASGALAEERPVACEAAERQLDLLAESPEARLCRKDEDCGVLTLCPIDCYRPYNRQAIVQLNEQHARVVRECASACLYECIAIAAPANEPMPRVICHNAQCSWSHEVGTDNTDLE